MSRRRPARPVAVATNLEARFQVSSEWRQIVDADADLERLADRLHRYARWSRAGASTLPEIPEPSTDPATTIDQLDGWLRSVDGSLDLAKWVGRRRWAWQNVLDPWGSAG